MKKLCLLLLAALLCFSCATASKMEPQGNNDTLVVGQVKLHVKNWAHSGSLSLGGNHRSGIKILVLNTGNKEVQTITSKGSSGVFYFDAKAGCHYKITEFNFSKKNRYGEAWVSVNPGIEFSVGAGKVFNLGEITWELDDATNEQKISFKENLDKLREIFAKKYKKSGWNNYDWEYVLF